LLIKTNELTISILHSFRLKEKLRCIEWRKQEHEAELNAELCRLKGFLVENAPPMTEAYKKHLAEPVCPGDVSRFYADFTRN
jgi:hypothetical protein